MTAVVREAVAADASAIRAILLDAFATADEATLVEALRLAGEVAREHVACIDGAVVGHVLTSRLVAPMRAVALAPLAVATSHHRLGIGHQLVSASIAAARDDGEQLMLVLGEPAYYRRFGFRAEDAQGYGCVYAGDYLLALRLDADCPREGWIDYAQPFSALG